MFVGIEASYWDSRLDIQAELCRAEAQESVDSRRISQLMGLLALYHGYLKAEDRDYNYNHYLYFEAIARWGDD